MYEDINNPALFALMGVAAIVAYVFLSTGLKALANRTNHFDVLTPVFRSCYGCGEFRIADVEKAPQGVVINDIDKTLLKCSAMLRDETRLTDEDYMTKWNFVYEQAPGDMTEVAERCPRFTPRLVNKDGSIG